MSNLDFYFTKTDDLTILNFIRQPSDDNLEVEVNNVLNWCSNKKFDLNSHKFCGEHCH